MPQIQNQTNKRQILPGRPNEVISRTPIEWEAVKITDSQSQVDVCFVLFFGTEPETGEESFAVINMEDIKHMLKKPDPHIREGILKLRKKAKQAPADLPEGKPMGTFELGEVG